jgi:2-dehydropantoate 2-reductase
MRANVGDVVTSGGVEIAVAMLDECGAIATANGFPPSPESSKQNHHWLTNPKSTIMASMLRDVERHAPTEADHMIGDLLRRGEEKGIASPMLRLAYAHLNAYTARREREAAAGK